MENPAQPARLSWSPRRFRHVRLQIERSRGRIVDYPSNFDAFTRLVTAQRVRQFRRRRAVDIAEVKIPPPYQFTPLGGRTPTETPPEVRTSGERVPYTR